MSWPHGVYVSLYVHAVVQARVCQCLPSASAVRHTCTLCTAPACLYQRLAYKFVQTVVSHAMAHAVCKVCAWGMFADAVLYLASMRLRKAARCIARVI